MDNFESAANGERNNVSEGGTRSFGARIDRMSGNAQQAFQTTRESLTDLRDRLDIQGRMERNPFGMLAAAAGVGYVLGGGLFSPLTGRIIGLGLRMALRAAAIPFIKDELLGLVEAATGAGGGEDADEGSSAGAVTGGARRKSSRQRSGGGGSTSGSGSGSGSSGSGSGNTNQGRQP